VEKYLAGNDCFELRVSQLMPLGSDVNLIVQDVAGHQVGFNRDRGVMECSFPAEHSGRYSNPQVVNIPEANNKTYTIISRLVTEETDLKTKGTLLIEEIPIRSNSIMVTQEAAITKTAKPDTTISILSYICESSIQQPLTDVTSIISALRTDKGKKLELLTSETPSAYTDPIIPAGQRREYEWRFYVPADAVGEYKGTITYTSNAGTLTQDVIVTVTTKSLSTPTPTPTSAIHVDQTSTPTPTPIPAAVIELNSASFSPGEQLVATFKVNEPIERMFNAYAVVIMPDGSMLDMMTLGTKIKPVATSVPSLPAGFTFPLLSVAVPPDAPNGEYELLVAFFDPNTQITGRQDAFLQVSTKFTIE